MPSRNIIFLAILFAIVFTSAAYAEKLSLVDAVKIAVEKNPDLQAAKKQKEAAQANIPKVLSLDDPEIGLEYEQVPSGQGLDAGMKMYTAKQMVAFPGKIYAEWQMARAEASVQAANYKAKKLEITSQVKSAYYDLFYADRVIETLAEIKGLLSKIKKSAEAKYVVGEVVQSDVLMANLEYLIMDNELATMQQEKEVKAARLDALLNRGAAATIETEGALNLPATLEPAAALEKDALENRPELLAMQAELAVKDLAQLKSKMEYFPETMLKVKKRAADGWDVMFSFTVPLYFWKQGYGVSSLGFEREAAEAAYNNMKNMTAWMLKESYVMADSAKRTSNLYAEKIVPQNSQALKVALAAYQSGRVDFQTLLQIERAYKEAKLKHYENQVNYGKAIAELERIIGKELM